LLIVEILSEAQVINLTKHLNKMKAMRVWLAGYTKSSTLLSLFSLNRPHEHPGFSHSTGQNDKINKKMVTKTNNGRSMTNGPDRST
jgi:hypothetical protein